LFIVRRRAAPVGGFHLNVDDGIVNDKGTLSLVLKYAKVGCNQTQSLPSWAAESFTALVSQRAGEGARPGDPLFVFYHQNGFPRDRLSVETIARTYKRYTERVGLGKIPPHSARASAATYLLESGCSDVSVAMFLRHCNEDQVKVYDKRAKTAERNPGLKLNYKDSIEGDRESD
jgi:integrase